MKRSPTLTEFLIGVLAVAALGVVLAQVNCNLPKKHETFDPFFAPEQASAQANQELVKLIAEQNRLMREFLNKENKK